ncbi:hydrogenase large subunit [Desulfovibrio cuneatus]|uniref:hydrogenase large subunit n=1 Tax=Desulfovibrio cuneatus TaxID=159728 RepID=UPI0004036FDB|nr:NADH-quinone oxidoreductase subunit C [Desulfovibrio cuneatus]
MANHITLMNGTSVPVHSIPSLGIGEFSQWLTDELHNRARVCAFFAGPQENDSQNNRTSRMLYAVLARDAENSLAVAATPAPQAYPAFTPAMPALHLFERELYEETGIEPTGHPWLKPVRFPATPHGPAIGIADFFTVTGEDVHEVAVGPIHAGIIECGHFRFQCQGEVVMHLEISLGYHHRGIEKALQGGPTKRTLPFMETLAGDTTIGHSWAYSTIIEALAHLPVAPRGQALRAVALELERLANHTGDLGALAGDIGYLPTSAFCGRLRGDFLNITALLCGNRFGRNLVCPGGTAVAADAALCRTMVERLHLAAKDVEGAANLMWRTGSVLSRMMGIGTVPEKAARDLGLVGPAARASGLPCDARSTHPLPGMRGHDLHTHTLQAGDVFARATMRHKEIQESVAFITRMLQSLPEGEVYSHPTPGCSNTPPLAPHTLAVALVEGWRGEVCHVAMTGAQGNFARYKVMDPSFHNWIGLAMALRGQQISDFPLCNKSFNLSYCGHDL